MVFYNCRDSGATHPLRARMRAWTRSLVCLCTGIFSAPNSEIIKTVSDPFHSSRNRMYFVAVFWYVRPSVDTPISGALNISCSILIGDTSSIHRKIGGEFGDHFSMYRTEIGVFSDGRTDQNTATKYCDFVTSGTGLSRQTVPILLCFRFKLQPPAGGTAKCHLVQAYSLQM